VLTFDWNLNSRWLWMSVWNRLNTFSSWMQRFFTFSRLWNRMSLTQLSKFTVLLLNWAMITMKLRMRKTSLILLILIPYWSQWVLASLLTSALSQTVVVFLHSWVGSLWVLMCFLRYCILFTWQDSGLLLIICFSRMFSTWYLIRFNKCFNDLKWYELIATLKHEHMKYWVYLHFLE
jgi:hypothetical protein